MLTQKELKRYSSFAVDTAREAGEIIHGMSRRRHRIILKGRVDLVTEADLASEKFVTTAINKKFPEHSILAEEEAAHERSSDLRWVVDPLDGTTNYAHNFPFYCVSIALEYRGEIVVGAIFDPERKEMFNAFKGGGAFLNGKRMKVSPETKLERSLLATGFPYDIGTSNNDNLRHFRRFMKKSRAVRRAGSAALDLCYLACGRFDGFWELKLHPWDTAAGEIMVEEAGGKVTDFQGRKYSIYGKCILASNGHIHNVMKKILAE